MMMMMMMIIILITIIIRSRRSCLLKTLSLAWLVKIFPTFYRTLITNDG